MILSQRGHSGMDRKRRLRVVAEYTRGLAHGPQGWVVARRPSSAAPRSSTRHDAAGARLPTGRSSLRRSILRSRVRAVCCRRILSKGRCRAHGM